MVAMKRLGGRSAVTALAHGQASVGAGVVIGSVSSGWRPVRFGSRLCENVFLVRAVEVSVSGAC